MLRRISEENILALMCPINIGVRLDSGDLRILL